LIKDGTLDPRGYTKGTLRVDGWNETTS
jgi:hypothetical protein